MNRNKLRAIVATGAVAAIVGISGFAFAAFVQTGTSSANGAAEKFTAVQATGTWLGNANGESLIPGESGRVRLVVNVPDANSVQGELVSITPRTIVAGDIDGIPNANRGTCAGWLSATTFTPTPNSIVVAEGADNVTITLDSAVALSQSATAICQGMTFTTTWDVNFQATRSAVTHSSGDSISL